eukprot:43619-Chlamydomonas_euryale.AAC.1
MIAKKDAIGPSHFASSFFACLRDRAQMSGKCMPHHAAHHSVCAHPAASHILGVSSAAPAAPNKTRPRPHDTVHRTAPAASGCPAPVSADPAVPHNAADRRTTQTPASRSQTTPALWPRQQQPIHGRQ